MVLFFCLLGIFIDLYQQNLKYQALKTKIILFVSILISITCYSQKKWTLKECVDHALENNISVKQNKLSIDSSIKDKEIAKGNFLPSFSASNSNSYSEGLSSDATGVLRNTKNFSSSLSGTLSGTIFNGFINLNTYKQAELGVKSSELDFEIIKNDISLNVVNTYLNVLFAKENLEVAKVQAEISNKQIERANVQFDAGAIPKGDLLNVKSTAANDLQTVITQDNNLNLALLNLSQLLQVAYNGFDVADIEINSPSASLLYNNSNVVYEKALKNRPEIEKAELSIENADLNYEINKGAYYPTVSYTGSLGSSYYNQFNNLLPTQTNDAFFDQLNNRFTYGASLSVSIPIFNRFQTKNSVAKAVISKEQTELSLESEKLRLQQTIEQAFLDAKAAAKTYEASKISLDAQKEAFKNAQVSYDYGSMTVFDFDQVRTRLVNAEANLIRSKYDYVFKTKVLKFYFGENITD